MPGVDFLDTNILVYAYDAASPRKQPIAQELVRKALSGDGVTSTQVLGELAVTLLYKAAHRLSPEKVAAILHALLPIKTITIDADAVQRAVQAHQSYGIHFYDGMIVAAAEKAGCRRVLSEDLTAGQQYFGVVVRNPFS